MTTNISLNQHNRNLARFFSKQQNKRTSKRFSGFKPKHHRHVKNKTKEVLLLKEQIEQQKIRIFIMARKIHKLNIPEVLL